MASTTAAKRKAKPQRRAQDSGGFGPIAERFRRAGDLERAVSLCREGLQKFPRHISARVTLGWSLLDLGRYDEARVELEQVLRRAPDNLAAIRGLAELHDRSEHTLNLPMDGPGQWPPTAAAVEQASGEESSGAFAEATLEGEEEPEGGASNYEPAVITPPDMGLAMWSPVSAAEPETDPVVERAFEPAMSHSSGMSSVRELDPNADFGKSPAPYEVGSPSNLREEPAVSEADIAALIAEADSLEAAADVDTGETEFLLDSTMDLGELSLDSIGFNESTEPAGAAALAVTAAEPAPIAVVEQPELAAQAVAEESVSATIDVLPEPKPVVVVEPVAAVEPVRSDEPVVADEPAAVVEPVEAAEALAAMQAVEPTEPVEPILAAQVVAAVTEVAHAHFAEVVSLARAAQQEPVRSPVATLERFLNRIQARRRQLVAESVA